jgi:hypothetical protein
MFNKAKLRLKIGRQVIGEKFAGNVEGFALYKEWDAADRKHYYWEEWEITGFNNYDSWVEYDHYSEKVTVYQPVRATMSTAFEQLKKGSSVSITIDRDTAAITGIVKEAGVGELVQQKGKMTYQLFKGDKVAYAEINTPKGILSVEKYYTNDNGSVTTQYDYYLGTRSNKADQKKRFGRVIQPRLYKTKGGQAGLIAGGFILFMVVPSFIPRYETYCTPRTATTSTSASANTSDEIISRSATQNCYRRRVFGGGSGGGGK